jgi:hypothetical protein
MQGDGCRMTTHRDKDYEPGTVPFTATPAGEPPSIREGANPNVWTERMLDTLHIGVRGGKNAYFDEHGLYSLNAAHIRFVQSTRG